MAKPFKGVINVDIRDSVPDSVTDDYPADAPWASVGGTIKRAIIDVSGEPFEDLANEARMAFARD
jgi:arylsulfatase